MSIPSIRAPSPARQLISRMAAPDARAATPRREAESLSAFARDLRGRSSARREMHSHRCSGRPRPLFRQLRRKVMGKVDDTTCSAVLHPRLHPEARRRRGRSRASLRDPFADGATSRVSLVAIRQRQEPARLSSSSSCRGVLAVTLGEDCWY